MGMHSTKGYDVPTGPSVSFLLQTGSVPGTISAIGKYMDDFQVAASHNPPQCVAVEICLLYHGVRSGVREAAIKCVGCILS